MELVDFCRVGAKKCRLMELMEDFRRALKRTIFAYQWRLERMDFLDTDNDSIWKWAMKIAQPPDGTRLEK